MSEAELDLNKPWAKMNARERKEYRFRRQSGTGPATATEPPDQTTPDIPEAERSDDDAQALTEFQRIALALGSAAADSEEEQRQADRIWNLLNGLTKGAQSRLFANPAVQKLFNLAT